MEEIIERDQVKKQKTGCILHASSDQLKEVMKLSKGGGGGERKKGRKRDEKKSMTN